MTYSQPFLCHGLELELDTRSEVYLQANKVIKAALLGAYHRTNRLPICYLGSMEVINCQFGDHLTRSLYLSNIDQPETQ